MILLIGKNKSLLGKRKRRNAFTFIELLLAVVIFSLGITALFRSFFIALDRITYLQNRLYATVLLDNHSTDVERLLRGYNALPMYLKPYSENILGPLPVKFSQDFSIEALEGFSDIFELRVTVTWDERNQQKKLTRTSYLLDI